ncbi:MAG: MFS transporter [Spirochaetes bacterium]|nr:MFS transporter [Spirochaetota bacterium]
MSIGDKNQKALKSSPKEIFGWCMFDFANSSYTTVIITAVFNAYFVSVVVSEQLFGKGFGEFLWGSVAIPISYILVIVTGPVLGAMADFSGSKKKFLFGSYLICIVFTSLLFFVKEGDVLPAIILIIISNFGYASGENFASAFLPELAYREDMGKVSGYSWSFGYWGGLIALACSLGIMVLMSEAEDKTLPVRLSNLVAAAFFGLSAIPTFLWLKERKNTEKMPSGYNYITIGFKRLFDTYKSIKQFKELIKFLIIFLIFNSGVMVVITFAAIYAVNVLNFTIQENIILIIVVNITASIGAFVFGFIQDKIGSKKTIIITLILWLITVIWAYLSYTKASFWMLANVAGLALGSTQSASRAMVGMFSPESKSGEFFGFWGLAGKLGAIIGPATFGLIVLLSGGSQRYAILSTGVFFLVGIIGMLFCDEGDGIKSAKKYEWNYDSSEIK